MAQCFVRECAVKQFDIALNVLFSTGLEILQALLDRGDCDDVFEHVLSAHYHDGNLYIDWYVCSYYSAKSSFPQSCECCLK